MSLVVTITGSPAAPSRTAQLTSQIGAAIAVAGFSVEAIDVRDLPAEDLLQARRDSPPVRAALGLVESARGVVISTPIYKASYSGMLKSFLDLLPQTGLGGKVVLPLATGGTLAHVLALDYALRPVLLSLGAPHVVESLFVLDKLLERDDRGGISVSPEIAPRLQSVVGDFVRSLLRLEASQSGARPASSSAAA